MCAVATNGKSAIVPAFIWQGWQDCHQMAQGVNIPERTDSMDFENQQPDDTSYHFGLFDC
jgi:hypothetical protein